MVHIGNDWDTYLQAEWQKPYYLALRQFLKEAYSTRTVYPPMNEIFRALQLTSYEATKVVILGQDPYHGPGQAHGLAFSVQKGVAIPPSLLNIYKELKDSLGCTIPSHGNLEEWAKQGVLLLNTVLTVEAGCPQSHQQKGWEILTDRIITLLNEREKGIVFLLWGASAKKKQALIDGRKHYILTAPHPSPLSAHRGFLGCKHFVLTNACLEKWHETPIDWQIR
jgi:uracil-DNA glycosylase